MPKTEREKTRGAAEIAKRLGITELAFHKRRGSGWYRDIVHRAANGRIWAYTKELDQKLEEENG